MDLYNMLQTGEGIEHLEDFILDLDSEFRFKCRRCGKCCIHQDTIGVPITVHGSVPWIVSVVPIVAYWIRIWFLKRETSSMMYGKPG